MSDRRDGWYWVKLDGFEWQVAEYVGGCVGGSFYINGSDSPVGDFELGSIGPRIPSPEEPWKTVPVEPTKVMREEFHEANEACEEGADDGSGSPDFQWKAMLAAAPSPGDEQ